MNPRELAAANALPWFALVGGLALLIVRRRRAPRATGLALPVLAVMAAFAAVPPAFGLGGWLPRPLFGPFLAVYPWVQAAGWVLLAVAVMAGRRLEGRDVH